MTRLESLIRIRESALFLADSLSSNHACEVLSAQEQLLPLVDKFYQENMDLMAPQQYEAAKQNHAYFLALVELAIAYAQDKGITGCADDLPS